MIHIACDFGWNGPYLGEMTAAVKRLVPEAAIIILMADMPMFSPKKGAYLLAALAGRLQKGDICLAIVDPGVGTERRALILEADGVNFVGPDNGIFEHIVRRAKKSEAREILWRPAELSTTFHGRDLFAPVAAALFKGMPVRHKLGAMLYMPVWPDDLNEIIYADHYGNLVTGYRADQLPEDAQLSINGRIAEREETFGYVPEEKLFWYPNSMGLVEIAVNRGSAQAMINAPPGTPFKIQ